MLLLGRLVPVLVPQLPVWAAESGAGRFRHVSARFDGARSMDALTCEFAQGSLCRLELLVEIEGLAALQPHVSNSRSGLALEP